MIFDKKKRNEQIVIDFKLCLKSEKRMQKNNNKNNTSFEIYLSN